MKVYVVYDTTYEENLAVFSTLALAEKYVESLENKYLEIDEFIVDGLVL